MQRNINTTSSWTDYFHLGKSTLFSISAIKNKHVINSTIYVVVIFGDLEIFHKC